ncbi:hypothetical protein CDL15_Pgr000577 [Punica granatum]|uniref:Uncharacterized protein n=1 Tax=Punica granatum TaxID=22663 RepID=A0A218W2X7_PUNGR|nr:hypothetical protein CDL15_Pgr000577 [Punica granatum]PKI51476.1 hypothetical protein CRG98_028187 [Punica granatum]
MVISEIIEEISEEELNDDYQDDHGYDCMINPEAQKKRIRRILEHQKSLYRSSCSSSCSSSASCSSSFSPSRRSKATLLELMRGGSTSLRRLFDMEHTSLADYFEEYSGSPVIKSIPLWGSDSDGEAHQDPWAFIREAGGWEKEEEGQGNGTLSRFASEINQSNSEDREREAAVRSQHRTGAKMKKKGRMRNWRLTRKRSFRKLPGIGFWRWKGFRFALKLRRRLRIMICGRMF